VENIKPLDSSQISTLKERFSPFLKEVKIRVIQVIVVFSITTIAGFVFYDKIIAFLIKLLSLEKINIVFTSPFQFISLAVSCGIATGVICTFPVLIIQILNFLKPALKRKEFRLITRFLPGTIFLFMIGFVFGAIIMKWQIEIFVAKSINLGIGNVLDISSLLQTILVTSTFLGIGCEFPLLLLLLLRIGLIERKDLAKKRPWVYLGSVLFAMLLPPDSIIVDIILALPFIFLFEITLILDKVLNKNNHQSLPTNNNKYRK